jgi:hypothetical protein
VAATENKSKQKQLKIDQLLSEIQSGNAGKVTKALKALEVNGDLTVIEPMFEMILAEQDGKIEQEMLAFLGDLKVTDAAPVFMEMIKKEKYLNKRQALLSIFWNSKIDFSDYLADFIEIACEGNFMEALECLTIIENMEGPFSEAQVLESQLHLGEYMNDNSPKDPKKSAIMSEVALLIKDFDLNINDLDD